MKQIRSNVYVGEANDIQLTAAELAEIRREEALAQISSLKEALASTDYKVVKNAECLALGMPFPYNAEELHAERQAIRDRINELEASL